MLSQHLEQKADEETGERRAEQGKASKLLDTPELSVFLSVDVLHVEVSEVPNRSVHDELSVILSHITYRKTERDEQRKERAYLGGEMSSLDERKCMAMGREGKCL